MSGTDRTIEMVTIIDMSGSMHELTDDTVRSYNSLIAEQKSSPGKKILTTVFFNSEIRTVHDRTDLEEAEEITREDYCPRGCTALLDAVGQTVMHIKSIHEGMEKVPDKTFVFIITDGYENASEVFGYKEVKSLIKEREEAGWSFKYLGSEIDAKAEAEKIGIRAERAMNFSHDLRGISYCCESICRDIEDC